MIFSIIFVLLSSATTSWSVSREAYKVVLNQSNYPQYLQFQIDMPPGGEFTICTWFKAYDLKERQNLITYAVKGNNEMMNVFINAGGKTMQVSIIDETSNRIPVTLRSNNWHHICFSYQSDYAAIALYLDSVLTFCGVMQTLNNYVLPTDGTLILGKTTKDKENGLNGEIYGTNMILVSTIEKKYAQTKTNQSHNFIQRQKLLNYKYSVREKKNINHLFNHKYISKTNNDLYFNANRTTVLPKIFKENKIGFSFNDSSHFHGKNNFSLDANPKIGRQFNINIWKKVTSTPNPSKLLDYEVPPTPVLPEWSFSTSNKSIMKVYADELSEKETPPPLLKDTKVYGQWTSSNYAGKLFKFVKSSNAVHGILDIMKNPPTIPLGNSDYPYPNRFVTSPYFYNHRFKRESFGPQINVKIVEDDYRKTILKMHENTKVNSVEVTNRGATKNKKENRVYRNAAQFNLTKQESKRIGMKKGNNLSHVSRLLLPAQHLSSSSEEVNVNNKWFNNPYTKQNFPQEVKFGLKEALQDSRQSKIPITKVVIRKGSDPEQIELGDLNCTGILQNNVASFKSKCFQSTSNQLVKVYPRKPNHMNLFDSDIFDKIFNRNVKLGNALNENDVIKKHEERVSFEGGNEKIPEINRFFSGLDSVSLNDNLSEEIPGSLLSTPCEMAKIHDRKSSGKITENNANIAKEFVEISYTQCSLDNTIFKNHKLLLIYWNKSTVSLFGGARHSVATDLCGSVEE